MRFDCSGCEEESVHRVGVDRGDVKVFRSGSDGSDVFDRQCLDVSTVSVTELVVV